MNFERCLGCMEKIDGYPCPHCEYDPNHYANADHALQMGTILRGRYLVGRVLGQGGFGITYIGWDLPLERAVAIKEYYPAGQVTRYPSTGSKVQWYSSQKYQEARTAGMELFLREARKMSRLDGIPQVVQVLELFQENNTAYIAMAYVKGETLQARIDRTGPMSWPEVKKLFLPIIQAMGEVHKAGLIHRDISPDNLMIESGGTARILDLGAAKDIEPMARLSSIQVAKRGFSPPEQYMQKGGSGTQTDVYSLAATMYFALTGIAPPPSIDRMDGTPIQWDLEQLRQVPAYAIRCLKQALILQSRERTQTMGEFARDLTQAPKGLLKKRMALIACAAVVLCSTIGIFTLAKDKTAPSDVGITLSAMETEPILQIAPSEVITSTTDPSVAEASVFTVPTKQEEQIVSLTAGLNYTVALYSDGTVRAVGSNALGQCDVEKWTDITQVSALRLHTVGVKSDGTVVATGNNMDGQCDVSQWRDVVAVSAGDHHTVGLHSDGTVVAVGKNQHGECDVEAWTDIIAVQAAFTNTIGLKKDGTVVVTGSYSKGKIPGWSGIVAIQASDSHFLGLCSDGTVKAAGLNNHRQCKLETWTNIVEIGAGCGYSMGRKEDGTVLFKGLDDHGQGNAASWRNITMLASGLEHVVGVNGDGKLIADGADEDGQCDVQQLEP